MSDATTQPKTAEQLNEEAEDQLKRIVAILIATTTIIAALAAFLQTDAGGRANLANRDAQRFAMEAMGLRAAGQSQVDYGWYGAAHNYYELDTLASSANEIDDTAAAERYWAVRDKVMELSPLMSDPAYFDPDSGFYPDVSGYEVDVYLTKATEMSERYTVSAGLNNAWNDKANIYIVHLTLLAVSLALYGLSTTIEDWTRWLFVGSGSTIVFVTVFWIGATVLMPVRSLSNQAIETYAHGYGLAWRGNTEDAITAFNQALELEPTYANAAYERGNAHFNLAADNIGTDPAAAQESLRAAAADFEAARALGRDDTSVSWNLGWTYYLLGFYEESATASRHALELDPNLFAVRCNLGLTLLADGQVDAARQEYAAAVQYIVQRVTDARAVGQEPPSSFWSLLDSCTADVDSMVRRLDDQSRFWTQAPPKELIADTPEVRAEAQRLIQVIKSNSVSLEFTGQVPGEPPVANISPFEFGSEIYDEQGNVIDYERKNSFPNGTNKVVVLFDYQGMQPGQREVWKVYRTGREDPALRVVSEWALEDSGSGAKSISFAYSSVFVFASGEYTAEFYVDNHLVQRGTFVIEDE